MSNDHTDQVVIKKKRRRIAVDPCLGYYENNTTSSPIPYRPECSKEDEEKPDLQGDGIQETGDSESVPPVTSLQSSGDHSIDFVTVEDFLRQQAVTRVTRNKKTYRRKAQRYQSSSDGEEEDRLVEEHCGIPNRPTRLFEKKRPAAKRRAREAFRGSAKSSTKRRVPFSKRMQQAATLSSVEVDVEALYASDRVPLQLMPRDQASPRTPPRDRRAKLIDPRIPRQLDTSFANKENTLPRDKTKPRRPFLQWSCPCPQMTNPHHSSPLILKKTAQRDRAKRDQRTPLDLVPYEEHVLVRSAKFDRNSSRKGPRMIMPLLLQPQPRCSVPTDSQTNVHDDPFMSLPLTAESPTRESSQIAADGVSRIPLEDASNDTVYSFTSLSPEAPAHDILIPRSSQSPSPYLANPPGAAEAADNATTLDAQVEGASDNLSSVAASTLTRSQSMYTPHCSRSQKPMRRIGTMLDSFRETARNVLLSQTQACLDQPVLNSGKPRPTATVVPRIPSRRLVFSSPRRHSAETVSEVTKAPDLHSVKKDGNVSQGRAHVPAIDGAGSASGSMNRVRKAISMPPMSVSDFLVSNMSPEDAGDKGEDRRSEDIAERTSMSVTLESTLPGSRRELRFSSRIPSKRQESPTGLSSEESRQELDSCIDLALNLSSLQEHVTSFHTSRPPLPPPTLFEYRDGYAPPNLFDLLEGAEPYNGVQVVLSPCF